MGGFYLDEMLKSGRVGDRLCLRPFARIAAFRPQARTRAPVVSDEQIIFDDAPKYGRSETLRPQPTHGKQQMRRGLQNPIASIG